jgi:hypothetical protein
VLGFIAGMLPSLNWIKDVINGAHTSDVGIAHIFELEYFLHAATDPLGINVLYSLGYTELIQFVKLPIWGIPLYLPMMIAAGIFIVTFRGILRMKWRKISITRSDWFSNPLNYNVLAFVLIPGILLTLSGAPVRSHYLIAAAPFLHALLAKVLLLAGRKNVVMMLILQAGMTLMFLLYIHNARNISGDYGKPYKWGAAHFINK